MNTKQLYHSFKNVSCSTSSVISFDQHTFEVNGHWEILNVNYTATWKKHYQNCKEKKLRQVPVYHDMPTAQRIICLQAGRPHVWKRIMETDIPAAKIHHFPEDKHDKLISLWESSSFRIVYIFVISIWAANQYNMAV